jgi:hypothetical protein
LGVDLDVVVGAVDLQVKRTFWPVLRQLDLCSVRLGRCPQTKSCFESIARGLVHRACTGFHKPPK